MERNFLLRVSITLNLITLLSFYLFFNSPSPTNSKSYSFRGKVNVINEDNIEPPNYNNNQNPQTPPNHVVDKKVTEEIETVKNKNINCFNTKPETQFEQKGKYWVLSNYIKAGKNLNCDESITYTTHGDFTFLDNLIPLVERWQGPVSFALYSPGSDFMESLKRILYVGQCYPIVRDLVTFHFVFDDEHVPDLDVNEKLFEIKIDCDNPPQFGESLQTYKKERKLFFPINVLRNVARQTATTHYVLASDSELYPNPYLIKDFLQMIRKGNSEDEEKRKVYILPVFEVQENITSLPENKKELVDMLLDNVAIPFHINICPTCHKVPGYDQWIASIDKEELNVFKIVKREGEFAHWEPFYIGTKSEPLWDERLTWEGKSNKMLQAYLLCMLDYELHVLDNGFLIHRPGIKMKQLMPDENVVKKQNALIRNKIFPELKLLFGTKSNCRK